MNDRRLLGPTLVTLAAALVCFGCSDSVGVFEDDETGVATTTSTSQALAGDACKTYCETMLDSGRSRKFGGGCQSQLAQCGISISLPWGSVPDCRKSCDEGLASTQVACLGSAPTAGQCLNCVLTPDDLALLGIGADYCGP